MPDSTASPKDPRRELPRRWWVPSLSFAEGFPHSLVRPMSTAELQNHGASPEAIGLTSRLGIPWLLKSPWAPLVDTFSTKRGWLFSVEGAMVAGVLLIGFASPMPNPLLAAPGPSRPQLPPSTPASTQ